MPSSEGVQIAKGSPGFRPEYFLETWTILIQDEKRIEAFEMWCWCQMMRIKWQYKIKNETVLETVKERKTIMEK